MFASDGFLSLFELGSKGAEEPRFHSCVIVGRSLGSGDPEV
jgi:hypothetical protein